MLVGAGPQDERNPILSGNFPVVEKPNRFYPEDRPGSYYFCNGVSAYCKFRKIIRNQSKCKNACAMDIEESLVSDSHHVLSCG